MNKKGQTGLDIFAFIAIVVAIFFIAPIALKVVNSTVPQFSNAIASNNITGGQQANQTGTFLTNTFTGFFDSIVVIAFIANVLVILISSFLVDIHPAFLIFYIVVCVLALIFAPAYFTGINQVYASSAFTTEASQLPISSFIVNNFGAILLGVLILSGIIIYSKYKFFGGNQ